MIQRMTDGGKRSVVREYAAGESAAALCRKHSIPRSTLYYWIQQYSSLKTGTENVVYYKEYLELKRRTAKLEMKLKVLQSAGCGTSAPLQEKLAALEKLHGQFSVYALCEALDVSRGTFYNHVFRRKDVTAYDKRREELKTNILDAFDSSQQRYGANKIRAVLMEQGIRASAKYVSELMREMGLQSTVMNAKREYKRRADKPKTRNLLQRQFDVGEINRVWVGDVTCFKIKEKYYYVCVVIDLYSRKVVAHKMTLKNSTCLVSSTFKRAFESRGCPQNLTFHSDRGTPYASNSYRKLLSMNNVVQSFSATGRPHDNAVSEAFFSLMKKEELYRIKYRSERELRKSIDEYIDFYNSERPHSTLAYKTPDWVEEQH